MIDIHFIVNPISGKGSHGITVEFLKAYFHETDYTIEVSYSEYKKHAVLLTQRAIQSNPHIIVACGGDGTINEVASCLVGTTIMLGIIPVGSGNGLASHLKIPRDINAALKIILSHSSHKMDVGQVNQQYFFSNMGIGIDALIIKNYEAAKKRTLLAYISASIKAATQFKISPAVLTINTISIKCNPFLLFISNSNEMGYGMSLTPNASLFDGMLDVVVLPKLNLLSKLYFGFLVLINKTETFKSVKQYTADALEIEMPHKIFTDVQIDGEYHNLKTNKLTIKILTKSLNVLIG